MKPSRATTSRVKWSIALLSAGVLASGAAGKREAIEYHCLFDNSGSIAPGIQKAMRTQMRGIGADWVHAALPNDALSVWWFTEEGNPYPATMVRFVMPALHVPAHLHRKRISNELEDSLARWTERVPSVNQTPLLESMYFIGTTRNERWSLTIFSDLQEDSRRWRAMGKGKDVERMMELCPPVSLPPDTIRVWSWPGLRSKDESNLEDYEMLREEFRVFLKKWAPNAYIEMKSLSH